MTRPENAHTHVLLKWRGAALRGLVALVLFLTIFSFYADAHQTLRFLAKADWRLFLAGLIVAALGELVTALKLQLLFRGAGSCPRVFLVIRSSFIAMFYNNLLPGSLGGDIVRILMLGNEVGGKARAAAGVFMQRNTGFGGLLLVAVIAAWFPLPYRLGLWDSGLFRYLDYPGVWFVVVSLFYCAANFVIISEAVYQIVWTWLPSLFSRGGDSFFSRLSQRALHVLERLHSSVHLFQTRWLPALGISVVTQLVDCFLVIIAAKALGVDLDFRFACVCVPAVSLAALLPITPNGLGLRETVYLLFLSQIGVDKSQAVAISLLHFSFQLVLSLAGGITHWKTLQHH